MEVRDPGVKLVGYLGRMYGGKEGGTEAEPGALELGNGEGEGYGCSRRAEGERL